jgi:hypothetical protein
LAPTGRVTRLTLVNAQTGADIQTIQAGATIDLGTLDAGQVSVRADVFPQMVGSVTIDVNGSSRTENYLPYSLLGDSYLQTPVTYTPWNPATGEYTITATPYSGAGAKVLPGTPLRTFSIIKPNTIVDVAAGNPNFSILVQAVTKAQLVDALKPMALSPCLPPPMLLLKPCLPNWA